MKRSQVSNLLRKLGLLYYMDYVRFTLQKIKNNKENKDFVQKNLDVQLPPDYLIYESFQLNYRKYYTDSFDTAVWLTDYFKKYITCENINILDWGCGPGRIIRHLPAVLGSSCVYYGTDYNQKSIEWCAKHLPGINFNINTLEAKLPYPDSTFDAIYGISIFTHLSEQLHYDWYNELYRVLKPKGIIFVTTHGDNCKIMLNETELKIYNADKLVVKGHVKEGHRTYTTYHPKAFMRKLFHKTEVLEHIEIKPEKGKYIPQDIWILKK